MAENFIYRNNFVVVIKLSHLYSLFLFQGMVKVMLYIMYDTSQVKYKVLSTFSGKIWQYWKMSLSLLVVNCSICLSKTQP